MILMYQLINEINKMENIKPFIVRMPKSQWLFIKRIAAEHEVSMQEIVLGCLDKYQKKIEKVLTSDNIKI